VSFVTDARIDDDIVLGASSFYTANIPILAAAALRYRRDSIFRIVDGQDVRTTGDANKWEHHTQWRTPVLLLLLAGTQFKELIHTVSSYKYFTFAS
jgi:hypothetical protein